MDSLEDILRETPLNKIIPKKYFDDLKILTLSFGEYLHYGQSSSNSLFFILDGLIQLKQSSYDGIDLNYGILEKFYFVGEKKILFDETDSIDFYVLKDNTTILEIPFFVVNKLIKNDKFRIFLLELHSKKLHKFATEVSILHFMGMSKFLAYNLLKYSVNDILEFKNISFLSIVLSMDRKSLYNAIKKIENEKLIIRHKNFIKILDRKGLEEYTRV